MYENVISFGVTTKSPVSVCLNVKFNDIGYSTLNIRSGDSLPYGIVMSWSSLMYINGPEYVNLN